MWFAVTGDVRFLSHRDALRLMGRACARARLPLAMSQGYNPRPKLSLALPRPVGVASLCELLVVELSRAASDAQWARQLRGQLPEGMKLVDTQPLPPGRPPTVRAAGYELELRPGEPPAVQSRLAELARRRKWEVTRRTQPRRRLPTKEKRIDIKTGVTGLAVREQKLSFTVLHTPAGAPRCDELLGLLGFAGAGGGCRPLPEALAQLVRVNLECNLHPRQERIRNTNS